VDFEKILFKIVRSREKIVSWVVVLVSLIIFIGTTFHILLNKKEPRAAALWLLLFWSNPVFGLILYWLLGIDRIRRYLDVKGNSNTGIKILPDAVVNPSLISLKKTGDAISSKPLLNANRIEVLEDGVNAYPKMLTAIAKARKSVALSTYIFDSDSVGANFASVLASAAARGVKVRVMVDGWGGFNLKRILLSEMKDSGVKFTSFWARDRFLGQPLLNYRNHRKLLIIDGKKGFTGGMNISQRYFKGPLRKVRDWGDLLKKTAGKFKDRDVHFEIKGPAVRSMLEVFARDWKQVSGETLEGDCWFPDFDFSRGVLVRGLDSGPDSGLKRNLEILLGAVRCARKEIILCTPYFIPDRGMLAALRMAAFSGVRVRLFIPAKNNQPLVSWASRSFFKDLLEAKVEINEIKGSFVHTKAVIVDNLWCLIGSSNLDPRSFQLNYEFNIEVYDRLTAGKIKKIIDKYQQHSTTVTFKSLDQESFRAKLLQAISRLVSAYL
jgi:cardiolipin synthase A/B